MPMPKTSMDEDYFASPRQHHVRPSRQTADVEAIAVAELRQETTYRGFRRRVPSLDSRHPLAAFLLRERVHRSGLNPHHTLDEQPYRCALNQSAGTVLTVTTDSAEEQRGIGSRGWLTEGSLVNSHKNQLP